MASEPASMLPLREEPGRNSTRSLAWMLPRTSPSTTAASTVTRTGDAATLAHPQYAADRAVTLDRSPQLDTRSRLQVALEVGRRN